MHRRAKALLREDGTLEVLEGGELIASRLGLESPPAQLEAEDALLLALDGVLEVVDASGRAVSEDELLAVAARRDPRVWVKVEVYKDLRRRGRIVVPGPRPGTLLVKLRRRSPRYDYYVLILEERVPVKLSTIMSFVEEAMKNGWTPVLAIVDDYGDVTYYTPSPFAPRRREPR